MNSLGRLHSLTKIWLYQISYKLSKSISSIFQEQINEDIIEKLNENKTLKKGKEFYLLHRLVIQEFAETNKKNKAKQNKDFVSFNEWQETGLSLQNGLSLGKKL